MKLYTETTDGATIEATESALLWQYQYADPDFGSCQAKELLSHLESVLSNEPVTVKTGHHYVEVKPQVSFCFHPVRRMTTCQLWYLFGTTQVQVPVPMYSIEISVVV